MSDQEISRALVARHLGHMTVLSKKRWPPIEEVKGFEIVSDRPYQGFDNDPGCQHHQFCGHIPEMWPARRFWCRSIEVRRLSDGQHGWGIGPQADAYRMAVAAAESVDRNAVGRWAAPESQRR